ncbi:MAG: carboxymuconolactone decarboxylase family protein [Actinomycetes bacterium]
MTEHSGASHPHDVSFGVEVQKQLRVPSVELRRAIPGVYAGFSHMHDEALAEGSLSRKTKELVALAIAVAQQCDGCIASHARGAATFGATPDEVAETLGVAILMMGGPGTVYGPRAFSAFNEFYALEQAKKTSVA